MITVCWAAKGGSGTTVVASSMAVAAGQQTLLVDLAGDVPAALGMPEPDGPGVADWLRSDAPAPRLASLELTVLDHVAVLPRGRRQHGDVTGRWSELVAWLRAQRRHVVVDAGSTGELRPELLAAADHNLLVTRPCYLALRAGVRLAVRPTGVVLIDEPGRALRADDVEAGLGAPVVATLLIDPAVARAVDAGLLAAHLPSGFRRALQLAARPLAA
jgi:hypothetical protein